MSETKLLVEETAKMLFDDIKAVHESEMPEREKASIELMGLNALCNAFKETKKSECGCK